jgi:DNA-directed RNA polymerase II subunit RPB9
MQSHALRLRGAGGNDRIPGQEEVIEYASTGRTRTRTIQYNDDPGRQTPFWLCAECGNMLYPKEDVASRSLKRICRNCKRQDAADINLVFVNDQRPMGGATDLGQDVTKDPTLPRTCDTVCKICQHGESVFFQAPARGDEGMKLIFMCTKCAPARLPSPPPSRHSGLSLATLKTTLPVLTCSRWCPVPTAAPIDGCSDAAARHRGGEMRATTACGASPSRLTNPPICRPTRLCAWATRQGGGR